VSPWNYLSVPYDKYIATLKNAIFWELRCVALVRTDVSEEHTANVVPRSPILVNLMMAVF
jgi:hypothetical protein